MSPPNYSPLQQQDLTSEEKTDSYSAVKSTFSLSMLVAASSFIILFASLSLNAVFLVLQLQHPAEGAQKNPTSYGNVSRSL